jgi:hypothetical protein
MSLVRNVLDRLPDAKQTAGGWIACCPAHEDRTPSLSISEGNDGRVLMNCFAGCSFDSICQSLGLSVKDLMPADVKSAKSCKSSGKDEIEATYAYRDSDGKVVFEVVRLRPKGFRQRQPDGKGGWIWKVKDVPVIPYRLPEILKEKESAVAIVEGEKDCDSLAKIGVLATCNAGGAGKWKPEHSNWLRGRNVCILPDNDAPGRNHARSVALSLQNLAKSVRIVELPDLPPKGDVSDWIAAGGTKDELTRLAQASPAFDATKLKAWPELVEFNQLELEEFPTDALPPVLREWVEAESHATQTPPDIAAMMVLAVIATIIARKVTVTPRRGWREPTNLFVAALLGPANRKSTVFTDAVQPLRDLEEELIASKRPERSRALAERRLDESRLRKLEKTATECDGEKAAKARKEATDLAAKLEEQKVPDPPRLIIDDATTERLGMLLASQGGRIASMSPEGGVFDLIAGLYSKSGMPQFNTYLLAHAGDPLVTDRVGRESVSVKRPALTCAYAIQPAVIEKLAENDIFRDRGLLGRFLYAVPESWVGYRAIATEPIPPSIIENYHRRVRELDGQCRGIDDDIEPVTVKFSSEAEAFLRSWEAELEYKLRDGEALGNAKDWGGKLAGATVRLAAILHCAQYGPTGEIGLPVMKAAARIGRYLIPHALKVLTRLGANDKKEIGDAQYLLRWIKRHDKREFATRDAQQHGKRRFQKVEMLDAPLEVLTRRGFIRAKPVEPNGPGRPPSPVFEVNPAVFEQKDHSQNSQNSIAREQHRDCGNIGNAFSGLNSLECEQALT